MRTFEIPRRLRLEVTPPNEWQERYVNPNLVRNIIAAKMNPKGFSPGDVLSQTFGEILNIHGQIIADPERSKDTRAVIKLEPRGRTDRYIIVEDFETDIVVWQIDLGRKLFGKNGVNSTTHKFDPKVRSHVRINRDKGGAKFVLVNKPFMPIIKNQDYALTVIERWLEAPGSKNAGEK